LCRYSSYAAKNRRGVSLRQVLSNQRLQWIDQQSHQEPEARDTRRRLAELRAASRYTRDLKRRAKETLVKNGVLST